MPFGTIAPPVDFPKSGRTESQKRHASFEDTWLGNVQGKCRASHAWWRADSIVVFC